MRASLLLFLLVCAVYAGSLEHGFHFDDQHAVVRNPHIRELSRLPELFRDPATFSVNPESAMYRPLLLASFAVNHAVHGLQPAGYHAVNVALHGLAVVALYHLVLGLGLSAGAATATGLLFAVHPVQSEAVNYVSSRSELLMGLLVLTAVALGLRPGLRAAGSGGIAAAGAMLTKAVGVAAPALLVLADAVRGGRALLRRRVGRYAGLAALAVAYVILVRPLATRALVEAPVRAPAPQAWTQAKAHAYYLWLTAMPVRLNVEHQFAPSRAADPPAVAATALLLSLAGAAVVLRRRQRWLAFGLGWWALVLLPTSVVPLIVLVNEHRLYLALVGVVLPVALCLRRLPAVGGRPVAAGALGLYTILLSLLAVERTRVWDSELSLWTDAAGKAPAMLRPHLRQADALAALDRPLEAEAAYLRALELRPHHPAARNNLGRLYSDLGRAAAAEAQYRALLEVSPDNVPARLNLGELLLRTGRVDAAAESYREALRHGDTRGRAQLRLGQIALQRGAAAQALARFDEAAAAGAADVAVPIGRGVALRALGRLDEAAAAYRHALRLDPDRADAWHNLGNVLFQAGAEQEAATAYRRAIDIDDDPDLVRRARGRLRDLIPTEDTQTKTAH